MLGSITAWLAKSALMSSPIGGIVRALGGGLKAIARALNVQGWIGLVVAVVLAVLLLQARGDARHFKKTSERFEQLYNGELEHQRRIAAQAVALKQKTDALAAAITEKLKEKHDEEDRRIAADARAIGLRGPGAAACPGRAGPAAGAGGHDAPAAVTDAAGRPMPAAERAAVPWQWLVDRAAEHDSLLNEVRTWREQRVQIETIWPRSSPPAEGKPK